MKKIKNYKFKILFVLFIIITFAATTHLLFANNIYENVQITAHRGSSMRYPENTFLSIEKAILENADYVEIDLRTTKDNQVIVFHDKNLKRIDGSKREIKDMTLEEIKKVDVGAYKNEVFKGEKVPTLEEVFQKFKGEVKFNLDLKIRNENDVLPKEVVKLINKYEMNDDVIMTSFKKDIIEKYKRENPSINTGVIISKNIDELENINSDIVSLNYKLISKEVVEELHNKNKEIHVWSINDYDKISRAMDLGVDNIITNNVSLAKNIRKSKLEK